MQKIKSKLHLRFLSIVSILALVLLAFMISSVARNASNLLHQNSTEKYNWEISQMSGDLQSTLNNYSNFLYSGRGLILADPDVTNGEWQNFYDSQSTFSRFPGMSSIYYAQVVNASQKNAFVAQMRSNPILGPSYTIKPAGDRSQYLIATLVSSVNNVKANGFDLYSTANRKTVYDAAATTGAPVASEQFVLGTGVKGMFIALPVTRDQSVNGFVAVSLRSEDFFSKIIDTNKLNTSSLMISDVTDSKSPVVLYTSANSLPVASDKQRSVNIAFGTRTWKLDFRTPTTVAEHLNEIIVPRLILFVGILLVFILILSFYVFFRVSKKIDLLSK
jgi:CHASE1-domain containing sensor protein